jgi:Flavodoxins
MKALVVYHSRKGTTRKFAEKIAEKLFNKNVDVITKDIEETTNEDLKNCDILYMGSWTNGRVLFNQKPAQPWVNFAEQMPVAENKKTVLFTTYTIKTGSMFRNMKKYIMPKGYKVIGSMKSRNGKLNYYSDVILRYSLN